MCGIAGALSLAAHPVEDGIVARMTDRLAHRGPDGAGRWRADDGRVELGFRRLAIIDLSDAANQPMANEDGSLLLVFNGEIYNHAEVRRELEQTGRHRWRTDHSDTEVIVHAWEAWGLECVERFRGMFALAVWDASEQRLWLVRDRIGVKPLYYAFHDGCLLFASEIKALLTRPGLGREIDEEALFHYLSFLSSPPPTTLFRGVRKLAAGSWLCAGTDGRVQEGRYWDAWNDVEPIAGTDDEIARRLLEQLRVSVQLRKVSDVPVGVFLSGGLDSSATAALFAEGETTPVQTFCVGYESDATGRARRWSSGSEAYRNEFEYARLVAERIRSGYHERRITLEDLTSFLPQMIRLQEEPIGDAVCAPLYFVSELARANGVVVCQAGEGADELFCGYPSWRLLLRLEQANALPVPRRTKRAALALLRAAGQSERHAYEYLRRGAEGVPIFWTGAHGFTEAQKRRLLTPSARRRLEGATSWDVLAPIRRRFEERAWDPSPLNWMSYVDLNLRLPELLLLRLDKMSMAVGLEARVPFLDHRFVELALAVPASIRVRDGELKYILKRALRGVVPDVVLSRRKQGFGVPLGLWFRQALLAAVERDVARFCDDTGLLDREKTLEVVRRGARDSWYLVNLALWWKEFFAPNAAPT